MNVFLYEKKKTTGENSMQKLIRMREHSWKTKAYFHHTNKKNIEMNGRNELNGMFVIKFVMHNLKCFELS